ncbi:MAG: GIY-YIG nuclease family protein [Candidatus Ranarchaeia archaeon]
MILCQDGTYYTGCTQDIEKRYNQHLSGKGARYTRGHKPKKIVYVEEVLSRRTALVRERRIKAMTKKQKQSLVEGFENHKLRC